jgi:cytochrome b561
MSILTRPARHSAVAQTFHWLTFLLVGAAYVLSVGGPETRVYSDAGVARLQLHETLGMLVFAIVVLRLIWRLVDRAPEEPPMPIWMEWASKLTHWALYALLIAIPLTAIIGAWYEAHPVTLLGVGTIGPWLAESHDLGLTITDLHRNLGSFIVWIAGVHAAAALFHHFIMRDNVLVSMLPAWLAAPVGLANTPAQGARCECARGGPTDA